MPPGELDDGREDDSGPTVAEQLEELLKQTPFTDAKLKQAVTLLSALLYHPKSVLKERLIGQCSVDQLTRLDLSPPTKSPPPSFTGIHSVKRRIELIQV